MRLGGDQLGTGPAGRPPSAPVRIVVTYAFAAACGWIAQTIGMPLPFILGPLIGCGLACAFGLPVTVFPHLREIGQVAVGLAAGVRFTGPVLAATLQLLPAMFGSALFILLVTMLAAVILRPLAGTDDVTAFFATSAGGMADMAVVAAERGGDAGAVSLVHALRVASVVSVVPFVVSIFGERGASVFLQTGPDTTTGWLTVTVMLLCGYGVARLLKPTFIPNPWLLGPLLLGAAIGASGWFSVAVPTSLIVVAQLFIGVWLGARFRRDLLVRLPRVGLAGLAVSLFMVAAAFAGAHVLSFVSGLPFTTSFLSLAPAAVTEMVLTAKAMNADVPTVTAFHVMRIAVVSTSVLLVFSLYNRIARRLHGPRI